MIIRVPKINIDFSGFDNNMVRILHFSDFHYKKDNASDFKSLAQKLSESIKGKNIDFIVFSGDLVFKDYGYDAYKTVYEFLFKPILKNCGLSEERIMIVPGNHDMQRGMMSWTSLKMALLKSQLMMSWNIFVSLMNKSS